MSNLEIIIILLTCIAFLAILSERIKFPFPILLVLMGLSISLVPGLPLIELNPDVVFLIFLPPLLYASAWTTSWHDFKANIRPISLAAIGLVFFTTSLVAWAAHSFIPGFDWPTAFVLGAIVSPPDAVAASSVIKGLSLHKRVITILEGESLVNDASGLIAYRYGISAVATGNFILWKAGIEFVWVAGAGIALGLAIGYFMALIHKYISDDPTIETVLTFLTPFISYLLAEHFHISGVLAVVSTGLYLTYRAHDIFSHFTRIQAVAVWQTVVFILNGVIFILIGLQLRHVLKEIHGHTFGHLLIYGSVISLVVILIRIIWIFPAAYIPRWLFPSIRGREVFNIKYVTIISWSGMRGVVSMAAAMALPFTLASGEAFPNRDIILFLTFCVIISTLVVQGISLPWLIKILKVEKYSALKQEYDTRLKLAYASIVHIEENISYGTISDEALAQIKTKYEIRINRLRELQDQSNINNQDAGSAEELFYQFNQVQLDLIHVERGLIKNMYKLGETDQEVLRKLEHELDLEEARITLERT